MTDTETNPLLTCVLGFLTPLMATGDIANARAAAQQAIDAYKIPSHLLTIAQIVGLALTSLDNLRLSMQPDLSLSMKLRLRGNANALTRSSQRATATLDIQKQQTTPCDKPRDTPPLDTASPQPTPQTEADRHRDLSWAGAMTDVAAEFSAELAHLPPDQRRVHLRRIGALTETASALKRGKTPLKSRLLGSTALRA